MNPLWLTYRVVAPLLGACAPAGSWITSPSDRRAWRERMGETARPGGVDAWVHAASMGEAVAAAPLVRELRARQGDARFQLTASTRTGRERLAALDERAALAPLDTPQASRRFLEGVRPERVFLIETELWPHWLMRARAEGIPVAIVSARISERSTRRYRRLGRGLRDCVGSLAAVLCQSVEDQQRWLSIGAPPERTAVVGNLKSDGLPEPASDRGEARRALGVDPMRPLLVLGNVRPGEARVIARAWRTVPATLRDRWQVVAVPRHPRALPELQAEALAAGLTGPTASASGDAWRWDARMGVLTEWYRAADVAVVGGTLAPYGGHNPMEPAACGAAVIVGPYHGSQREGVRALEAAGAIWRVSDGHGLVAALEGLLSRHDLRLARAEAGVRVASAERGSARRAVDRLTEWGLWPVR